MDVKIRHGCGYCLLGDLMRGRCGISGSALCALILCVALVCPACADRVLLQNGAQLNGEVVAITPEHWLLRSARGDVHKLPVSGLKTIAFEPRRSARLALPNAGSALNGVPLRVNKGFLQYQTRRGSQFFPLARLKSLEIGERCHPTRTISRGGMPLSLSQTAVPGKVTLFVFCTKTWNVTLRGQIEKLAASDPDVFLRFVDIGSWGSELAKQHKVESLPHILVFDRRCKQIGTVCTNISRVQRYVRRGKAAKLEVRTELDPSDISGNVGVVPDKGTTNGDGSGGRDGT